MSKMSFIIRKKWWILLGLLAIALIIIFRPKENSTSTDFVYESVKKTDIIEQVNANGFVSFKNTYNINPRTNAKVIAVNVKTGDLIKKDQELIKFDDTDLQNAYKSAQYTFNSAVYARDRLKNAPIVDDYAVKQAQQQVNITWVSLENSKRNLENAYIKSPIDGVVSTINLKVGDFASVTQLSPAIVIGENGELTANLTVNELDIAKVKIDQDIDLEIEAIGKVIKGKVTQISPSGVNLAGVVSFAVKASIPDQKDLLPEMTINGLVTVKNTPNVLSLPSSAIREKSGKSFVYVPEFDESGALIKVIEKEIQIGVNNNSMVEIISGLNEGDKVVLNYDLSVNTINFSLGGSN